MNQKLYWIWLSRIEGIGSRKIYSLLDKFKKVENIWNAKEDELIKVEGIGEKLAKEITNEKYKENLTKYLEFMVKNKIDIITIQDENYPYKLKQIYDSPAIIYIKGNKEILNDKAVAMVGCRNCTKYGKEVALKLSYQIAKKGITIISGLAVGIDAYSHIGCIKAKGKTIAVVGNGLDNIYPYENKKIADEIIENGGAIISEYIIGSKPAKLNFPARNRIISGLSDRLIVVEARKKSGTLITVDFALEQGKDIYVVPGNINSICSEGTNDLIKQGANILTSVEDIHI